ncbi:hypothetical protein [Mycolicibacterium pyrenivorans]|uniref:hypothetical protein n=1 Tax=Mycolicibacterium pyrenivorans TaxID=187102 RepID=UPI0021F372C4|nr:hypothetical protein [Mycolicibacterium pyrenivorans]MCV7150162.1 hypothetical protein [Mycolicibacterium pyrenivorans]
MREILVVLERHAFGVQPVSLNQIRRIDEQYELVFDPDRPIQLRDAFDCITFINAYLVAQLVDSLDSFREPITIPARTQMPSTGLILSSDRPDTMVNHARTGAPVEDQCCQCELEVVDSGIVVSRSDSLASGVPDCHVWLADSHLRCKFVALGHDSSPERSQ